MDIEKKTINEKYLILMHGIRNKNVADTCRKFGISRTIYYKWYGRFQKYGIEGLNDIIKEKRKNSNKIPKYLENEILKIIKKDPTLGPRSISYIMKENGYCIGETGIYNVMKRLELNIKNMRVKFSENSQKIMSGVAPKNEVKLIDIEKSYAGYVLIQWTTLLGNIKDIGKIYQITVLDAFSNYAIAKIYKNKTIINAENIMESSVIPTARAFEVKINNIITKNSREYTTNWENGKHRYEQYLEKQSIKHMVIQNDCSKIINILEDFQKEIYCDLYKNIIVNSENITFKDIEIKLQEFLRFHNYKRNNDYHFNKGKTPIEIIGKSSGKDITLPLWAFVDGV